MATPPTTSKSALEKGRDSIDKRFMNLRKICVLFIPLLFFSSLPDLLGKEDKKREVPLSSPEIVIPAGSPVFLVVKGIFKTREEAVRTLEFIQELLVKTPADGIISSNQLKGFPPNQWVIASAFDSEKKAKWWLDFGDRNKTLPKPFIRKAELAEETLEIPYFPDAIRENFQRFHTEEEVLKRIQKFPDVQNLQKQGNVKFLFIRYPRTRDYSYEVEILEEKSPGHSTAYDFVVISAVDLNHYSRLNESLKRAK